MTQQSDDQEEDMGYDWDAHELLDRRISSLWMYQDALSREKVPENLKNDLRVMDIFNDLDIGTPMDARIYATHVAKRRDEGVELACDVAALGYKRAEIARHYAGTINSMFLDEDLQEDAAAQMYRLERHIETLRKELEPLTKLLTAEEHKRAWSGLPDTELLQHELRLIQKNPGLSWDPSIASLAPEEKVNVLMAGAVELANQALRSAYLKTSLSEVFMSVAATVHMFTPLNKTPLGQKAHETVDAAGLNLISASWDLATARECRNAVYVMENIRRPYFIFQAP